MMSIVFSFVSTVLIIFIVPIVVYALFSKYVGIPEPEKKRSFFVAVLIQKIGTAVGFVALYSLAKDSWVDGWLLYGAVWAVMFSVVEIGQSIAPGYSKKEAAAGIVSECIYFPLAAFVMIVLL